LIFKSSHQFLFSPHLKPLITLQFTEILATLTGSSPSPCGRVKFSARKFWEGLEKKKGTWYLFSLQENFGRG